MQRLNVRLLVMLLALTLLAVGCAKKPVAEEAVVEEPTEIAVIEEQQPAAVTEEAITDDRGAAAARAAAEAREKAALSGLGRIYFDFDQYVLTDVAKRQLAANAELLQGAPALKVKIEGHCDERGSDEYNLALGEKRALATKNYMVSLGVADRRISIISYGEELPLDPAKTEEAWAKNRRAEFKPLR